MKYLLAVFVILILFAGCTTDDKTIFGARDSDCTPPTVMDGTGSILPGTNGGNPYLYDNNNEEYDVINENSFHDAATDPVSTFSIDVDAASYSNVRRFLNDGHLPPIDAVRIEELINYFHYDYPEPDGQHPFSISTEIADCPWGDSHRLIHIGLQGESIALEELPPSNLVFLLDVSGSMSSYNKLPLLKEAFGLLVEQLTEQDRVAIVTYSSVVNLKLPSTSGDNKDIIMQAINSLNAGGSTAGEAGIQLAYETALENFIELGNNRVILATDGDFNVGISDDDALVEFIETKRDDGVYLTVLGFGTGNLKGSKMEKLADNGNGNYAYIDNINEAEKTLVNEIGGTLLTIAKDVKVQVEFNPEQVNSYRLIGYENRLLNDEDFDDDLKDAGDMGAGHSVTALYEINPAADSGIAPTDPNMITLSIRYKEPDQLTSQTLELSVFDTGTTLDEASDNFLFSSAAAQFGLLLRDSEYKGKASTDNVLELAGSSLGEDVEGYRQEFVQLVEIYAGLAGEM